MRPASKAARGSTLSKTQLTSPSSIRRASSAWSTGGLDAADADADSSADSERKTCIDCLLQSCSGGGTAGGMPIELQRGKPFKNKDNGYLAGNPTAPAGGAPTRR